jgi:hypothetical protein
MKFIFCFEHSASFSGTAGLPLSACGCKKFQLDRL